MQVANFTDHLATIQKGCILGWDQDAASYLDSEHNKSEEEVTHLHAHASAIVLLSMTFLISPTLPNQVRRRRRRVKQKGVVKLLRFLTLILFLLWIFSVRSIFPLILLLSSVRN